MNINFTGGLIKCGDTYISPDKVMFFQKGISYINCPSTDVFLYSNDNKVVPLRLQECNPSDFADAFIKAENSDGIYSVNMCK